MKGKSLKIKGKSKKEVSKKGLPTLGRKRKASQEVEPESSDDGDFPVTDGQETEKKVSALELVQESDSDDEGDSDKELQIALRDGLLKTDRLNYLVEKKRPIINKTAEMREKIAQFAKKLPWIETVDVTTQSTLTKDMINNDFERELQFYQQAEKAVQLAVPRLLSMGIKVIRPSDYYAEMAKSDGHMQKVRKRLLKIQEGKERQEAIRRMREEKKYAAKVQKEVLEKRNSEKKLLMEAVKKHKKGMKQQLEDMLSNVKRMGLDQDDEVAPSGSKKQNHVNKFGHTKSRGRFDAKKQWKSEKFGYGGKKKGRKRNDKESFESISAGRDKSRGQSHADFRGRGRFRGGRSRGSRRWNRAVFYIDSELVMLLELVSGVLIFIVLIFCTFFPYCYLLRRNRNGDKRISSLSICNCVACGIFLSTCFLGLIPHVRHQEEIIRVSWNSSNVSGNVGRDIFLSTELVVLLGFLMILVIEQLVLVCSHSSSSSKTSPSRASAPPSLRALLEGEAEDGQPLVDTTLDDHDDGMQDIVFRSVSPVEHSHIIHTHAPPPQDGISARTLFLLFGLSTHSLFEGVALGVQGDRDSFMNVLIAVMFHEVLCCIAYGVSMAQQYTPVRAALPTVLILSGSIPTGMFLASLVDHFDSDSIMFRFVLEGLAAGTFVYVACVEMLSAELRHSHHHHSDGNEHHEDRAQPPSTYQGLMKATAVVFGVFLFWSLQIARGGHH
ncbi:hypothetical protein RB195_016635 [Necator americanus]